MNGKILIGYDKSDNAEDALALGKVFCELLGAKPWVVTVVHLPDHLLLAEDAQRTADRAAEFTLAVAADRLAGMDPETTALPGTSPAHRLYELLETDPPMLLVLGSCHRGRAGQVLVGSVAKSLLSGGGRPIAIAPKGYAGRDEHRLDRIGVAFDGSPDSKVALATALGLAKRRHAELTLIAVAQPPHPGWGSNFQIVSGEDYFAAEEREKDRVLAEAMAGLPGEIRADSRRLTGDPAEELSEAAADLDLLVVGSRGYGMIKRVLLGGVSAELMRMAPCPVLVMPRAAGDDPLGIAAVASEASAP